MQKSGEFFPSIQQTDRLEDDCKKVFVQIRLGSYGSSFQLKVNSMTNTHKGESPMSKSKKVVHSLFFSFASLAMMVFATEAKATVFNVGPGQTYTTIGAVPWESLNAGDTVNIYYQATPYKEKFVLSRVGTSSAPITVHGVLGPNGERPILDGNGATTR
jgi:hypothetical protein